MAVLLLTVNQWPVGQNRLANGFNPTRLINIGNERNAQTFVVVFYQIIFQ